MRTSSMFFGLCFAMSTAIGMEPPVLQKNDYPIVASIRCTDLQDEIGIVSQVAGQLQPLLSDYGYARLHDDNLSKFTHATLSTTDPRFPAFIIIDQRNDGDKVFLDITTRGDLTADGYSGHSDAMTFTVAALIKPFVNTKR